MRFYQFVSSDKCYDIVCACSCHHRCYKLAVLCGGVSACDRHHGSINQKPSTNKARSVYSVVNSIALVACSELMQFLASFVK